MNPVSQRSPRGVNIKGQFYAVHGRGMSLGTNTVETNNIQARGILNKIFKSGHNRTNTFNNANYLEALNQTATNSVKPSAGLREHLNTQGRTRQGNVSLEPPPNASLGTNQRGGSLNIQELVSHY